MYLEYSLCSYKQESYWWGWASGGLPRWEALLLWGEDEVVGFVLIGEKKATGESGPSVPHRRLLIRQNQALCGDAWQECEFKQGNFLPDIRFSLQGQSNIGADRPEKSWNLCLQCFSRANGQSSVQPVQIWVLSLLWADLALVLPIFLQLCT